MVGQLCLRIKGNLTGSSVHAPRQRNSVYLQTFRRSIYDNRRPEHSQSPIRQHERRPKGPASRPCYRAKFNKKKLGNRVWAFKNSPTRHDKELLADVEKYLSELANAPWQLLMKKSENPFVGYYAPNMDKTPAL